MHRLRQFIDQAGWPRIIIGLLLVSLFAVAPAVGVSLGFSLKDTIVRFGMNSVLVLAMIPMVQAGCGLNFGLPLGIIAGLLGTTLSIELGLTGVVGFAMAIVIAIPFALILGWGYGALLNHVKGDEMMIATYVGFSAVSFFSIMWMVLPYHNPTMIWGFMGAGLRTTISLDKIWSQILDNFLAIHIGPSFMIPTGTILFFALMALIMWAYFHTKTGTAMTAVGSNPDYARASGISVDRMRTTSVILSTIFGAIGIVVYEQSYGFVSLYAGPFFMAFPAIAAILIGGASANKANITNVIIGTLLFQGLLTMTPSIANALFHSDVAEVVRLIASNGMVVYALTREAKRTR
jgi:simple sugar transport system permease protein